MKNRSFQIALSAVSAALAAVFMIIGLNVPFTFIVGYVFAGVALMLPLAKNFRAGGFLAYAAASLLCLPLGGIANFYKHFPFIVFFGLYPVATSLQEKWKIGRWVAFPVKAVWFDGMLCATWALFSEMFALPFDWMRDWIWLILIVGGTAVFFLYEWMMYEAKKLVSLYVSKIDKSGGRRTKTNPQTPRDDVGDVFGGDFGAEVPEEGADESAPGSNSENKESGGESRGNGEGGQ